MGKEKNQIKQKDNNAINLEKQGADASSSSCTLYLSGFQVARFQCFFRLSQSLKVESERLSL